MPAPLAKYVVQMTRRDKAERRKYPWQRWFAKGTFTLRKGYDYDHKTRTMMQMTRNVAYRGSCGVRACHVVIVEAKDERSFTVTVKRFKDSLTSTKEIV